MAISRYTLDVSLSINKEEWNGRTNLDGTPNETEGGYWNRSNNERLSVNESLMLGSMDFLGLMAVLAQLHSAIKAIPRQE